MASELVLRPGEEPDLVGVARVHLEARLAAGDSFPSSGRSLDDVEQWVRSWDLDSQQLWVADLAGSVVGYARFSDTWLDDLYVAPEHQRSGVGSALLGLAQGCLGRGFGLWVFAANRPARSFYLSHGLVELEDTDGSANEEGVPDVRMLWPGEDPLGTYRRLIDEADTELGDVLARRAALTAAVQAHKRTVHDVDDPGRDAAREADVAARVAGRVPALGPARVARIMHVIITESIEASR